MRTIGRPISELRKLGRLEERRLQERREEWVNSIIHGAGLLLSLAGVPVLMTAVQRTGDAWQIGGCVIYLATLLAVYTASTLSHAVEQPERKRRWEVLDQAVIYLLIAGTYTPFAMAYLRGPAGWLLTCLMWGGGLAGFLSKVMFSHQIRGVSLSLYLLLGWLPVTAMPYLWQVLPASSGWMAVLGGVCYTVGVFFLAYDHVRLYLHGGWHLAVLAGSALHYAAILRIFTPVD